MTATGIEVLKRSKHGYKSERTAERHMERAFQKSRDANVADVWQYNADEGRWHWWIGYDHDEANREREEAEKAVQP